MQATLLRKCKVLIASSAPFAGAATVVHDDKLWVFGGVNSEGQDTCNHMWAYDFCARQWSLIDQKGLIPAPRARAYTAVHEGRMLMYGYLDAPEDEVCPRS